MDECHPTTALILVKSPPSATVAVLVLPTTVNSTSASAAYPALLADTVIVVLPGAAIR
jgi:hypothetical protein